MDATTAGAAPGTLPSARGSVIYQEMDDGAVLYCTESEVYFGLNATGVHIWRFLAEAEGSLDELVRAIEQTFPDAPDGTVRADVEEFLAALEEAELVTRGPARPPPR